MDNTEKSIPIKQKPWGLQWALLFTLFAMAVMMTPDTAHLVFHGSQYDTFFLNIAAALAMVGLTVFAVKRFKVLTWAESFQFLGYKKPSSRLIVIGLLSLFPIRLFYEYAVQSGLVVATDFSPLKTVHTLVLAGLLEETLYRGFIFQLLRRGRSFIGAAVLSGLFWALAHAFANPVGSAYHPQIQQMATVFLQSIPDALLFEWGGNVIWGCMVSHVGYDLIVNMFGINPQQVFTGDISTVQFYNYFSTIASGLLVWGLAAWLLPRFRASAVPAEGKSHFRDNQVSAQWAPWITAFILAVAGVLVFGGSNQSAKEKKVIDYYQQMVDENPDQPTAHLNLGLILEAYQHADLAIGEFTETIRLDPNNYMAYVSWGECLNAGMDYIHAIPLFQKALLIDPDYADAYLDWGYSLEGLGKYDEALPMLEKALRLNPSEVVLKRANAEIEKIKSKLP